MLGSESHVCSSSFLVPFHVLGRAVADPTLVIEHRQVPHDMLTLARHLHFDSWTESFCSEISVQNLCNYLIIVLRVCLAPKTLEISHSMAQRYNAVAQVPQEAV